jgi:rhamnose transport system permease protein
MNLVQSLFMRREAGILVMIVLFCVLVGLYKPQFLTGQSLRIILLLVPLIMIGAMAQMLVLVARHVDLSIGSILGFSAMVVGLMYRDFPDVWWIVGFPVALATGAALGLANGVLVTVFKLPSIIVTLGTLSLYRGLTFIISDARQINRSSIPSELKAMSRTSPIFDIPWIIIIAFGVALLTYIIARP